MMRLIQEAVDAQEKVVVHCWGGGGRTGRLLAAYMVSLQSGLDRNGFPGAFCPMGLQLCIKD